MRRWFTQIVAVLALSFFTIEDASGDTTPRTRCRDGERAALLKIKHGLHLLNWSDYEFGSTPEVQKVGIALSNWGEEECCEWIGIRCDNETGRVVTLDLSPESLGLNDDTFLKGNPMSSSLAELRDLRYLDLSCVGSGGISVPSFIGNFAGLRYLNLSFVSLSGEVPAQLGNLSNLQVLDLSGSGLYIPSLSWASRLSSLRLLNLGSSDMTETRDWLRVVNNLPSLTNLALAESNLGDASELSFANTSKSLAYIDLSLNYKLTNSTLMWLSNYSRSLVHFDMSGCWLELASIPEGFADITSLSYLALTYNFIRGSIPESLGNLTSLTYLDLSQNEFEGLVPESFGKLTSLEHLDLHENRFEGFVPKSFGKLTNLKHLDLHENRFEGVVPESFGNLSSLEHLDLHTNMLQGELPKSMWEICTLKYFDAQDNDLSGWLRFAVSSSRCDNFSLEYLDLKRNRITGPLYDLTLYPLLKEMRLSSNRLSEDVSESIGKLSNLETLDLSFNNIQGTISEAHFAKLFRLRHLDLSSNQHIIWNVSSDWIPPFQLAFINLGYCNLGPRFPRWLDTQNNYYELNVSHSGISDSIPSWLWNFSIGLDKLDLSKNELNGTIPDRKHNVHYQLIEIDLSLNMLEGSVPLFLLQIHSLNLNQNRFSDISSICNVSVSTSLAFLDISYNRLTGELPNCLSQMKNLEILILGNNRLTGEIPNSIGDMTSIKTLHLANNDFSGTLPVSLENCTELNIFDVGGNKLTGEIPTWTGASVWNLFVLSLRSNNFYGSLQRKLCQLENLQVLDLSSNNLSGEIPSCFTNFTRMRKIEGVIYYNNTSQLLQNLTVFLANYNDKLTAQWKGSFTEIQNLGLRKNLDLSHNKLSGEIPKEFTELIGLVSLNLSRNNLSGQIPKEIGRMRSLDALDFSKNQLSGKIPSSLSQIDRLGILDLSGNNLSGKIPSGTQLQNREASAYKDNPELCGAPLPKKCPGEEDQDPLNSKAIEYSNELITNGFYISAAVGYFIGFCGICGSLAFIK